MYFFLFKVNIKGAKGSIYKVKLERQTIIKGVTEVIKKRWRFIDRNR